ncbi:hypothetical protein A3D11_01110 [Candidatus Peribacteria bacterium RIFCSPHIGHO2_02_FULL_49_16]|nr:MAG: hypothetical protein A2880_02840 [Candidatus Peribacteria bacterium RIFCSPHIGHO2_01_FULL_49_38]OGJ58721.1 MAG: hypothetical protein A3D11_01110 [Candidatus Peribacteria bacterium RIFCSPHIGHO2_02_FULL_49_16]
MLKRIPIHLVVILVFLVAVTPMHTMSNEPFPGEKFEQEFLITAYYSPKPDQCCYVLGGLEADRVYNGQGMRSADGTEVYAGMIAAPPRYPFGTRIILPGLGTFIVHDRGGAIRGMEDGSDRLDIWVGEGEEGLARAFMFGLQKMRGTVYPSATASQLKASVDLQRIPLDLDRLNQYRTAQIGLPALRPKYGQRGISVVELQRALKEAGYDRAGVTGVFDDLTRESLRAFLTDFHLDEPDDALTERTGAALVAARLWKEKRQDIPYISSDANEDSIRFIQRTLRRLGYYHGRTNGLYDDLTFQAILSFQKDYGLASDETSSGAGHIGPITSRILQAVLGRVWVEWYAGKLLDRQNVVNILAKRGELIEKFLGRGEQGNDVRLLQSLLVEHGFFPEKEINGVFGALTARAVGQYQLERGVITGSNDDGAEFAGPATLRALHRDRIMNLYNAVRAEGWGVL